MKKYLKSLLFLTAFCLITPTLKAEKIIHLFVALCDNETQGIQPVGKAIGDGNKPDANLYWGCSDGAQRYFTKSKLWTKLETHKPQSTDAKNPIMRRIIFQHKRTKALLIADAYQGKHIKQCITDYLNASAGSYSPEITVKKLKKTITGGANANLTAFIGHNGLMEFDIETTPAETAPKLDTITLCCVSNSYFKPYFSKTNTNPILQTKSLMYPGSFILHDALEGWFKNETKAKIRTRAAKAYAKNQKIKVNGAYSVFPKLEE